MNKRFLKKIYEVVVGDLNRETFGRLLIAFIILLCIVGFFSKRMIILVAR